MPLKCLPRKWIEQNTFFSYSYSGFAVLVLDDFLGECEYHLIEYYSGLSSDQEPTWIVIDKTSQAGSLRH
jgi:hypothetical protein